MPTRVVLTPNSGYPLADDQDSCGGAYEIRFGGPGCGEGFTGDYGDLRAITGCAFTLTPSTYYIDVDTSDGLTVHNKGLTDFCGYMVQIV